VTLGPGGRLVPADARTIIDRRFRDLVQLSILTLLVTGAVITFDRLQREPGPPYVVTLGIKIALAIWMFLLAQDLANRGRRRLIERRLGASVAARRAAPSWLILGLGMAILLLSDVLKVIGPAS
jgi:putative copper export protein